MYLLLLGVALLLLKYLAVGPVADWSWWWVLSPFALTLLWWWFADQSGYTRRKAMEKETQRKADRVEESRKRLGMPAKPKR
ncbi:TIGR04438 family Trp-rich protein [Aquabacterium sp. A08]|uniref:TIGR04438 family Trp-rich protein n=1 Tax=Aquabacterium sp. A08 TaxID=2718532 RepID=UPI001421E607|nr:TIGR04438 family Trp-rich protein [Aquabacterium sp. A08]NIC43035.1 TIGR04438 family Trp-rich protein [Aquabacterium sp. A08]